MDDQSITIIVAEIQPLLLGRPPGKIFQLDALTLVIDFRLRDHRTLLISVNPSLPRIHLINRRLRDLEKQSVPLGQFALALRKQLSIARLTSIAKDAADRIIRFEFAGEDDAHRVTHPKLIAQLTGRSANLFLVNQDEFIVQRLRPTHIAGQQIGDSHRRPAGGERVKSKEATDLLNVMKSGRFNSPSEAADAFYQSLNREKEFDQKALAARARLKTELARQRKLLGKLEADLASHADAEYHKRIGDLLLANVSSAKRSGKSVKLIDYFDSSAPTVAIEVDEQLTLPQEASRRFALYSRSKRAVGQIKSRIERVNSDIAALISKQHELDRIITARDPAALDAWSIPAASAGGLVRWIAGAPARAAADTSVPSASASGFKRVRGTRRYISSDGLEILVGRASKDNDYLTFKIARPNDLWLHSADYPGSHVIVRNPTRKDIPHRTIIEAAQLAAYFSQANKNAKVDVHYTPRKFLSKPKGTAPGLVRMSRFKNLTVEPRDSVKRA